MPNILKKSEVPMTTTQNPNLWDPFQEMRALLSWDPFRNVRMPYATEGAFNFAPAFEVKENKEGFFFKADIPGVKEADLDVQLTGDRLVVSGKRESEHTDKNDTFYAYERSYGSFQRTFTLPHGVDAANARAELKDGVLTIMLPRTAEAQPKKIAVKAPEKMKA